MTAEETAAAYDSEAEATGWLGPQVAFGLVYEYVSPGQSVLDLGMGTGRAAVLFRKAGLRVSGMDLSQEMLDACRTKGFDELTRHDLTEPPYPYSSQSFDHVACIGVLSFLSDLSTVFAEAARLLRPEGTFAFMTLDRAENEDMESVLGPEHTKTGGYVTIYRHSAEQIGSWIDELGFVLMRSLPFTAYMDPGRRDSVQAMCYVARSR